MVAHLGGVVEEAEGEDEADAEADGDAAAAVRRLRPGALHHPYPAPASLTQAHSLPNPLHPQMLPLKDGEMKSHWSHPIHFNHIWNTHDVIDDVRIGLGNRRRCGSATCG